MRDTKHTQQHGFTIVELLIVVIVIGILAAVTIVAYAGISDRATVAALKSDLNGAAKVLHNDKTTSSGDTYPPTLAAANGGRGIVASNGASYQYTVDDTSDPKGYCLTITKGLTSYYVNQTGVIQAGYCTNHVAPADNTAVVTTLAGSTQGYADGTGTAAQFFWPAGIAVDSDGMIYVAEIYGHRIRKITPSGEVTTFAGSGTAGYADGTGTAAQFNYPQGVAVDANKNVYVADRDNHRIRKITPSGTVTTFAGSGVAGTTNATGTSAQFSSPYDVAVDGAGNVYVADRNNCRIRKITSAGVVTTLAGSSNGYLDGTGTGARFSQMQGIDVDASGNVYVADRFNNRIRKITSAGVVTTIAGSTPGFAEGTGTAALFKEPTDIAVQADGTMYVTDTGNGNNRIRKITSAAVVSTTAGSTYGTADGTGTSAQFAYSAGIVAASGNVLYVSDQSSNRIRKIQLQ